MTERRKSPQPLVDRDISVFLLEDNRTDSRLIQEALSDSRWYVFHIKEFSNLQSLLDALDDNIDDSDSVLLIDLNLPDSQGVETYKRVYAARPHSAIIILTGMEDEKLAIETVRSGAQDYFVKGEIESDTLAKLIAHAKERQQVIRQQATQLDAVIKKSTQLDSIVQHQTDGVLVLDNEKRVAFTNEAAGNLLNRDNDELVGLSVDEVTKGARNTKLAITSEDGFERNLEISFISPADSKLRSQILILRDVTHSYRMQDQLLRLVNFDAVTGLYNYSIFESQVNLALNQLRRMNIGAALVSVDIKRFKRINTALGHQAGDQLLQGIADRLRNKIRTGDVLARYSGDEFLIFMPAVADSNVAAEIADKVLDAFRKPFEVQGHECLLGASIGVSLFPSDGDSVDSLVSRADTAMLEAKQGGQYSRHIYTPDLTSSSIGRLEIEQELRTSLGAGEFNLEYQPKVDLKNGIPTGAEALLRWTRPDGTPISPLEFVPILEDTGMIGPVGEWVLRESCKTMAKWRAQGTSIRNIAVNVSPVQFNVNTLPNSVRSALKEANIPASCLELEITESLLLTDVESNIRLTQMLRELGVRSAIDDFGTGFSSLAYLKQFAVDNLKIDRSFVKDLQNSRSDAEIVVATIGLAHNLRLTVTAEGVEEKEQLDFLKKNGCDFYQGYFFSKPRSADDLLPLLKSGR